MMLNNLHGLGLSHVSSHVSHVGIVRVLWADIVILFPCNLLDEEEQEGSCKDALPHSLGDVVPHLVVYSVDFLHSFEIVCFGRGVGESPNAQVMHMLQSRPVMAERYLLARLQEGIVVYVLAGVCSPT